MKKLGIVGVAIIVIILGGEYMFASWLQDLINLAIPKGEWYNLIHLISIVLHIFFLGGIYIAIAFYSAFGIILLTKD